VWFVCGIIGSVMLGEQRIDVPRITGGPITLWQGFNKPVS
jgi:hypothetical protein